MIKEYEMNFTENELRMIALAMTILSAYAGASEGGLYGTSTDEGLKKEMEAILTVSSIVSKLEAVLK